MRGTFYTSHGHCPENAEAFLNDRVKTREAISKKRPLPFLRKAEPL
jgi:hypothetical protein